jgi:acetolactate synthase regulatory subunit
MGTIQEARSELRLITGGSVSAAFGGGQPFDIFDELRRVIETTQTDILFVDPYMGADFVSRYLPHVPQGVTVRLLTKNMVPQLTSALGVYTQQHPLNIEARISATIHGRFLCVDRSRSFTVDASFKDAAKSAPAALIELTDTAAASLSQYETLWLSGTKVF